VDIRQAKNACISAESLCIQSIIVGMETGSTEVFVWQVWKPALRRCLCGRYGYLPYIATVHAMW
jgi:hypothetical protein